MLKKILAGILIGALSIISAPLSLALDSNQKTQINSIIPSLSTEKLQDIEARLEFVKNEAKYQQYQELIQYISLAIEDELLSRMMAEPVFQDTINPEAKASAEADIMEMQMMMGESLKSILAELMISWQEASNVRETGNMSLSLEVDVEDFEIEGGISLSDYMATSYGFDQKLTGQFEAFIQGLVDGERVDIDMQTFLDFISVEGNMYLLLENLNFSDTSEYPSLESSLRPYVEKMQELAKSQTYIAFESLETEEILSLLQNFTSDSISAEIDMMMGTALFEAYSEQNGVTILRPTQHFCNVGKTILDVFDPFYSDTMCSEAQYQDLLEDFANSGITLSLSGEEMSILNIQVNDDYITGFIDIAWDNQSLSYIESNMYDPNNRAINNLYFNFIPQSSLVFDFLADEEIDLQLDVKLSKDTISSLDMTMNIEDFLNMQANYANNYLDITGSGNIFGTNFTCEANGRMDSEYINLNETCIFIDDSISYSFPNEDTLYLDSSLEVDLRSGKNNIDISVTADIGRNKIFKLIIRNSGLRQTLSSGSLSTPEKIILQEAAFSEIYEVEQLRYESYNFDDYYIYDEETGEELYCERYEYNEENNYDYCISYIPSPEYTYDYDDYYITDPDTGIELFCETYEYSEEDDYDYCTSYIEYVQNYDDFYIYNEETGEELYCERYEYNEEDNYDYCISYIPSPEYTYDYDDYYITDPDTGIELFCETYEYSEEDDYDYCTKYTQY